MANLLTYDKNYATTVYSSNIMGDLIALFEKFTQEKSKDLNYEDMLKSFTNFEFLQRD